MHPWAKLKIKLHILGVPMHKLRNWLIPQSAATHCWKLENLLSKWRIMCQVRCSTLLTHSLTTLTV